jgi:glycosyltransferase involved in cell wall biosynthesis
LAAMRVLILAPWPFRVPRYGGPLRGAAVAQAYRKAGHEVYATGFYNPTETAPSEVWPEDIPLKPGVVEIMQAAPAAEAKSEMAFWAAVAAATDSFAAFVTIVRAARPAILQFEEPALWPVVRRLRAEGHLDRVAVVHSSYNFETVAWRHRSVPDAPVTNETLRDIAAYEQEIAASCNLVIAVSESDAEEFRRLGAAQVCVAANGVASLSRADAHVVSNYLSSGTPYALFVSSAHPPNAHGLVDLAAAVTGHPVRHGEILICGRVGPLVRTASNFQKASRILERSRFLGWVDNTILSALYAGARAVIVPKTYGGGSNLKIAEALASGRPVVATRRAFDGFETFMELPGVIIADDPDSFWAAVNDLLADEVLTAIRPPKAMSGLLWSECMKPMVQAAEEVVRGITLSTALRG